MEIDDKELAELKKKAEKWDALGYTSPYVMPENYDRIKADSEKWRKVKEIAKCASPGMSGCDMCPIGKTCDPTECAINADYPCEAVEYVVKALEAHIEQK